MKIITFILIFLCFSNQFLKSQALKDSLVITDTLKILKPVVSVQNFNILYLEIENSIEVAVPGYKPEQLFCRLKPNNFAIMTGELGKYKIRITGKYLIKSKILFDIFVMQDSQFFFIETKEFHLHSLPEPELFFGSKHGGMISPGEIRMVAMLRVFASNCCNPDVEFRVKSYSLFYQPNEGIGKLLVVDGECLTMEVKYVLAEVRSGEKIVISDVIAEGFDNGVKFTEKKINGIELTVR